MSEPKIVEPSATTSTGGTTNNATVYTFEEQVLKI